MAFKRGKHGEQCLGSMCYRNSRRPQNRYILIRGMISSLVLGETRLTDCSNSISCKHMKRCERRERESFERGERDLKEGRERESCQWTEAKARLITGNQSFLFVGFNHFQSRSHQIVFSPCQHLPTSPSP